MTVKHVGEWELVERYHRLSVFSCQGLTSVVDDHGATSIVYRGDWSIPRKLRKEGWVHIGDPSSSEGRIFDAYEAVAGSSYKLFAATTRDGVRHEFIHMLAPDELFNNSFACISPEGKWLVSGEWGEMNRLLVFPAPIASTSTSEEAADLPLAGTITLDRPVRNVQGATFINPTTFLCSTDDPGSDLWPTPRQLLQVALPRPLDGDDMSGRVTSIGPLPMSSWCRGVFEVEGIDYDATTKDLRVAVIPPGLCGKLVTAIYRFRNTSTVLPKSQATSLRLD